MFALEGLRVIDLTWWIAGPHATEQLAMMGAEVIRLESARRADSMRSMTPFVDGQPGLDRSGRWISHNFSKRSVLLDLGTPEGSALAKELVKVSDVVVENFSSGVMERLGLGYEELQTVNPKIILCSVSAVGRTGPQSNYIAFGPTIGAYSGLAYLASKADGSPGAVEPFISDYVAAFHVVLGVLAALRERRRTGRGRRIEISMAEAQMSQLPEAFIRAQLQPGAANVNADHEVMAPHGYYPCAGYDRWIAIAIREDEQWQSFCDVFGKPHLANDPRFADGLSRQRNKAELDAVVNGLTRTRDAFELQEELQAAGVPAGVALTAKDATLNPHLNARGAFIQPEHPIAGRRSMIGLPWKLSDSPPRIGPAPMLGADTDYVLGSLLGLDKDEIERLRGAKVIA